jgi:Tfp pilus assembly protein PilF
MKRQILRLRVPGLPTAGGHGFVHPGAAVLGVALLALAACGTGSGMLTASQLDELAARQGLPAQAVELPFLVTDEMRTWLDERVDRRLRYEPRLDALLQALLSPDQLGVTYDASFTGTAPEVFARRRANCLGFTNLFVAMARELDVPVHFLFVDEVEGFDRVEEDDLVVVSRHITAGYGPAHDLRVLEFSLGPEVSYKAVRRVSDTTAVALYYSNRGAELLRAGDVAAARRMLAIATGIDTELPLAWVNLGVVHRRSADYAAAERAYRRALELDSRQVSAYQNLASLYQHLGRREEADRILAVIPRIGSRNPYNYLSLGDVALARGDLDQAHDYYRKALKLYRDHPEPYAALGQWALERGDQRRALYWLERASQIDPGNSRVRRLAERLTRSSESYRR